MESDTRLYDDALAGEAFGHFGNPSVRTGAVPNTNTWKLIEKLVADFPPFPFNDWNTKGRE